MAPNAWLVNFTNPAGMVTEALRTVLGDRVIGICDSPIGLVAGPRRAAVRRIERGEPGTSGSTICGWLRSLQ